MSKSSSCQPGVPWRERTVERVVEHWEEPGENGFMHGIFAAEVCQVCGRLDVYAGFMHAVATHLRRGRRGEFTGGRDHDHTDAEVSAMEARDYRFCELCRAIIGVGSAPLCGTCEEVVRAYTPRTHDRSEVLHRVIRWRYHRLDRQP